MRLEVTVTIFPDQLNTSSNKPYIDWLRSLTYGMTLIEGYNLLVRIRQGTPYVFITSYQPKQPPVGLVMDVKEILEQWEIDERARDAEHQRITDLLHRGAEGDAEAAIEACKAIAFNTSLFCRMPAAGC